jgi:hypothetical protein
MRRASPESTNAIAVAGDASSGPTTLFAKLLGRGDLEHVRGCRAKRLHAAGDPRRAPEREDDREAERGVVEDDEGALLLPHRASRAGFEEEVCGSV